VARRTGTSVAGPNHKFDRSFVAPGDPSFPPTSPCFRCFDELIAHALFRLSPHLLLVSFSPRLNVPRSIQSNSYNEATNERKTNRRIFDSRTNDLTDEKLGARGGTNAGEGHEEYYAGSVVPIEWTNLNSCGGGSTQAGQPNNDCNIVMQVMCEDGLRDGTSTDQIDTKKGAGGADDTAKGRHESYAHYSECKMTQRNLNLYTANQPVKGVSAFGNSDAPNGIAEAGAIYTRQNPAGAPAGYECPEERDYYPYWRTSPWIDVAILTNTPERCEAYVTQSQNLVPRAGCVVTDDMKNAKRTVEGWIPNDPDACQQMGGLWKADYGPAHNQPAPLCLQSFNTRDNQLGNTDSVNGHIGGYNPLINWTIPASLSGEKCAFRIRYNISASENGADITDSTDQKIGAYGWASLESVGPGIDASSNQAPLGATQDTSGPTKLDVWTQFGMDSSSVLSENIGLAMKNDPLMRIFNEEDAPRFHLAFDTSNFFRTSQDRSHMITIGKSPAGIAGYETSKPIHNVNVRGKRGNIVQSFPSTEYDFVPNRLHARIGDFVHFQWTGSDTNDGNNAGNASAGKDRSNLVMTRRPNFNENGALENGMHAMHKSSWARNYPTTDLNVDSFLGWGLDILSVLAYEGAEGGGDSATVYVQPQEARKPGCWRYMSTVANNFTNRSQKAEVCVSESYASTASMGYAGGHVFSGRNYLRVHPGSLARQHKVIFTGGPSNDEWESDWVNVEVYAEDQVSPHQFHLRANMQDTIDLHMAYVPSPFTTPSMYRTIDGDMAEVSAEFQHEHGVALAKVNHGGMHVIKAHLNLPLIVGLGASTMFILGAVVAGSVAACRKQAKSL
jgi:hypothetical protein